MGIKNTRMSRTNHATKRWHPAADQIAERSGPGKPKVNADVGSGLAPKKASPFKDYVGNTKPPAGRALPHRGEAT